MIGKIKIRLADKWFARYIYERDGYICQRCLKKYPKKSRGFQVSHFFGRGNESVRFDPDNCDSMCSGCHAFLTENPSEHYHWKKNSLGNRRFDLLDLRAHTPAQRDDKMVILWCKSTLGIDRLDE